MRIISTTLIGLVGLTLSSTALAGGEIGQKAPALSIAEWVKGSPVDVTKAGGKVHIVEFWATWCGPCRAGMPHLSELQKQYKDDVVIIGVTDESAETVNKFLKDGWSEKMQYTVVRDKNKETSKGYMKAFGVTTIPHAFIVDRKGRIAWHGDPRDGMDDVLKAVVAGTHDIDKARDADRLVAKKRAKSSSARMLANEYRGMIRSAGNESDAALLGGKILAHEGTDAQLLNAVAWDVLTSDDVITRDLNFAMIAAELANLRTGDEDPMVMDTYALALFKSGRVDEAVSVQERAVKLFADVVKEHPDAQEMMDDLKASLAKFRKE